MKHAMDARFPFLRSLDLFSKLEDDDLLDLISLSRTRTFMAREPIFRQGDPADGMFIIESGRVRVSVRTPGDDDLEIAVSGPGALLGEVAILDGGIRSATAVALEPVTAHFFNYGLFQALRLDHRPAALGLVREIARIVCVRLRASIAEIGNRILRPMPERLTTLIGPLPTRRASVTNLLSSKGFDVGPLRAIPFFAQLTVEEREMLQAKAILRESSRGDVLSREGEHVDRLRIIVRGAVQKRVERGEVYQRLFLLGPGRISGAAELIDGGRRVYTSIAREELRTIEIPMSDVEGLIAYRSTLGLKLFSAAVDDLMYAQRRMAREKVRHSLEGRIDVVGPNTGAQRGF